MDKETLKHLLINLCTQKAKDQFAAIEAALSTAQPSPFTQEEIETILAPYRKRIERERNYGKTFAAKRDYKKKARKSGAPFLHPTFAADGFRCVCAGKGCERREISKDTPRLYLNGVSWHVVCLPEEHKPSLETNKKYQAWQSGHDTGEYVVRNRRKRA